MNWLINQWKGDIFLTSRVESSRVMKYLRAFRVGARTNICFEIHTHRKMSKVLFPPEWREWDMKRNGVNDAKKKRKYGEIWFTVAVHINAQRNTRNQRSRASGLGYNICFIFSISLSTVHLLGCAFVSHSLFSFISKISSCVSIANKCPRYSILMDICTLARSTSYWFSLNS